MSLEANYVNINVKRMEFVSREGGEDDEYNGVGLM